MKKIEAIIRRTRFDEVKEALFAADINWFSYSEIKAIGQDREDRIYRGVMYSTDIISRIEIKIICREQFVQPAVDAIIKAARTGEMTTTATRTGGRGGPAKARRSPRSKTS